jgi:hypothetical protein
LFASLVLLTATAKRKEKKSIKTGASRGHITNLKQSILETFDIYTPHQQNVKVAGVKGISETKSK